MQRLTIAALAAAMCAAPALGVLHVELRSPNTELCIGETTMIEIWGRGDTKGLWTLAGSIVSSGDCILSADAGSFTWLPPFTGNGTFLIGIGGAALPGSPGANGGWTDFASSQNVFPANQTFAKDALVKVATYTVTCVSVGSTTLSFQDANLAELGIATGGGAYPADRQFGTLTSLRISEVPEPMTLALLALGGLVAVRRRGR